MTRQTKIVVTLGPASNSPERIAELIGAGMDVARINASHGDRDSHARAITSVRTADERAGRSVGVLFDLQGPKIRLGAFAHPPLAVAAGDEILLAVGREPEAGELPSDYALLDRDVRVGDPLLIDDGAIGTDVIAVEPGRVRCRVRNPGIIMQRKGINLPKSAVSAPAVTAKDRDDALFAAGQGVDALALSFVRRAEDVTELRDFLAGAGFSVPIIAKIEKPQALVALDDILRVAWGVMVARGDLGVELEPEQVPMAQKQIIRAAVRAGRPVITATQMLESMRAAPRPTRAEASDVANAVIDGTDAVMLSSETAVGAYPVESVRMMVRIIEATEQGYEPVPQARRRGRGIDTAPEAVADACCHVAGHLRARQLVAFTRSGATALLIAQRRPPNGIVALTPTVEVQRLLTLAWGVRPLLCPDIPSVEERIRAVDEVLLRENLAARGDRVVIAMGAPTAPSGHTNVMQVHHIGEAASA